MDGSQFDAWTRRGFGAAAGGLAGTLLALSALPEAEAKKKKKKKCKKNPGDACNDNKKKCCCGLACREPNEPNGGRECCKIGGSKCSLDEECCSGDCNNDFCFCKNTGQPCEFDNECCSFDCNITCQAPA